MDAGFLVYEYNMLIIDRFQARSAAPVAAGEHVITVDTRFASPQPMAPATVTLDGRRQRGRQGGGGENRACRLHRQ